jgi:hypothetical protein
VVPVELTRFVEGELAKWRPVVKRTMPAGTTAN